MNELSVFQNEEFGKVRTLIRDGEPWFVANDVAEALGYAIPKDAVAAHCKYAELFKGGDLPPLTDSPRGINIIPESDVYALIFRSNLPKAEAFRAWVCEEVLPSLRKTGQYTMKNRPAVNVTQLERINVLRSMLEAAGLSPDAVALGMNSANRALTGDDLLALSGVSLILPIQAAVMTPTQIGAEFGLNARKINKLLEERGYQTKTGDRWVPTELGKPYARMESVNKSHNNGTPIVQTKWFANILPIIRQWIASTSEPEEID